MAVQHIIGGTSAEVIKNSVIVNVLTNLSSAVMTGCSWGKVTLPGCAVKPSHCHSLSQASSTLAHQPLSFPPLCLDTMLFD